MSPIWTANPKPVFVLFFFLFVSLFSLQSSSIQEGSVASKRCHCMLWLVTWLLGLLPSSQCWKKTLGRTIALSWTSFLAVFVEFRTGNWLLLNSLFLAPPGSGARRLAVGDTGIGWKVWGRGRQGRASGPFAPLVASCCLQGNCHVNYWPVLGRQASSAVMTHPSSAEGLRGAL